MRTVIPFIAAAVICLSGCGAGHDKAEEKGVVSQQETEAPASAVTVTAFPAQTSASYKQISQEEADDMMTRDDGHIIVDVRRSDEYESGHIPGAVLIPNESITDQPPAELPDKDGIILIYCRSGNRSKQAAQKLADMGYTNIYEFGGINTWTGETVRGSDEQPTTETSTETAESEENIMDSSKAIKLTIDGREVPVEWEENESVTALSEMLPLTIDMSMYGGFEQVGAIGESLPRSDVQTVTGPGDIVLYSGDQIVIFYGSNSWAYTRLGHIGLSAEEMTSLLSGGDVTVTLS